jgi:hypothetical protein
MNSKEDESSYTDISRDARNVGNTNSRRELSSSRNGSKSRDFSPSEDSRNFNSNRTDRSTRGDRNIRDADNNKATKMLETKFDGVLTT